MAQMPIVADDVKARASVIREQAEAAYTRTRSDGRLSVDAIRTDMAVTYTDAKRRMDALQASATQNAAASKAALIRQAFGIDDIASGSVDRAAASMSYREAIDRAQAAENPQALAGLLKLADDVGDELLARAVAKVAWDNGASGDWMDILQTFVASRPQADRALGELFNARTRSYASDIFAFTLPKPPEIATFADYQIASLAEAGR